MMDGGRQKLLGRMVDRAWCRAIIFRTANNLGNEWVYGRAHLCVYKYLQVVTVRKRSASVGFVSSGI
jgi:hypothetical protein